MEFRYPKTGDRVMTKFGSTGIMLGMARKPEPHKPWVWADLQLDGGPFVVMLEQTGAVRGFQFDEVKLA